MALDVEEQQQVEQVKKWLAEYGLTLIIAVIGAAVLLFGYQRWTQMRERAMEHASVRYEQLFDDLAANQTQAADNAAAYLIKRYPTSTYAKLADLLLANRAIKEGDFADAQKKLLLVTDTSGVAAIKEIARIRLARLQLQLNQPQAALDTLKKMDAQEFLPTVAAVRGDAYAALKNNNMARDAYQQALAGLPEGAILRPIIAMKLSDLSG